MQKITPHLWFDKEAVEAAEFYTSIFPNSKITSKSEIKDTPSGDCDIVDFEVMGYRLMAISAGPYFKPNPSISFMINFDPSQDKDARERIDEVWEKLSEGGKVLMPLDKYPFSERYGWIQDKFGFSWQLIYTNPEGEDRPLVIPSLLFVSDSCEKAEEATDFYLSIFKNSKRGEIARYPAGMEPSKEGAIMFSDFMLEGQWLAAMDASSKMHDFDFNEAISLIVHCKDQSEIDYFWQKLSAVSESEQCGWLKDKYGVSWQIIPENMGKLMNTSGNAKDEENRDRRHITNWAFAQDDWQAQGINNDLHVGGNFKTIMSAKDGSVSFDFIGTYTAVTEKKLIEYAMDDGRQVKIEFENTPDGVKITESFDPESENSEEMQRAGWQAILNNFKTYIENN